MRKQLYNEQYYQANKGKWAQRRSLRGLQQLRERNAHIKEAIMNVYTNGEGTCRWCGQGDIDVLTVDHINNDGAAMRRTGQYTGSSLYRFILRNSYPDGFQVLCFNCNVKKRMLAVREACNRRHAQLFGAGTSPQPSEV